MEAESQGSDQVRRSASLISNVVAWRVASPTQVEERITQLEVVKDYYGKLLKSSKDLKTSACCDGAELPPHLQPLLANVHPEGAGNITAAVSWCQPSSAAAACSIWARAPAAILTFWRSSSD